MTPEMIGRAIQLILAPVVMISACSIFVGGVLNHYTSLGDRIRALARERLDTLRALNGESAGARALLVERLEEIDGQLPELLDRHRLVHHAVLAVYVAVSILVLTMCVIALTATITADWVGPLVFGIFVAGVLMMFIGVLLVTLEIRTSRRSLSFEARRVSRLSLGLGQALPPEAIGAEHTSQTVSSVPPGVTSWVPRGTDRQLIVQTVARGALIDLCRRTLS